MIRLLGRGFIILPLRCKLAGLWWSFSLMVICGYVEQQQQWPLLVITANFAGSTFAVMAVFKTRKYPVKYRRLSVRIRPREHRKRQMEYFNNILCITQPELLEVMSESNYKQMVRRGKISRARRGGNGRQALIVFDSLPGKYRSAVRERNTR